MSAAAAPFALAGGAPTLTALAAFLLFLVGPVSSAAPRRSGRAEVPSATRIDLARGAVFRRRIREPRGATTDWSSTRATAVAPAATAVASSTAAEAALLRATTRSGTATGRSLAARMRDVHHQTAAADVEVAQGRQRLVRRVCARARHEAEATQPTVWSERQVHAHRRRQGIVGEELRDLLLRDVVWQVADIQRAVFLAGAAGRAATTTSSSANVTAFTGGDAATFASRRLGRKWPHRNRPACLQRSIE